MERDEVEASTEDQVFKSLSHPIRRDIIRVIGERGSATFTEIKNALKIDESASLSYHLNGLGPLLRQQNSSYSLNHLGKHAYRLILGATSVGIESSLKRKLRYAIVANALFWAGAIIAVSLFQGKLHFETLASLAALFSCGNVILVKLSD